MSQNFDAFFWIQPIKSNPLSEKFDSTRILWHFPDNITPILNAFQNIPQFCFPDIEVVKLDKAQQSKSEHFTFTLTDDNGVRIFGICMRSLDGGVGQKYGANRRPKHCLCIITRNPYFAMFKTVLQQIHSLYLLDQTNGDKTHATQRHFLASLYTHKLLSKAGNFVIPPNPRYMWYSPFILVPGTSSSAGKGIYSMAPLMEVLGVEAFFLILSAILCENRVLFIADEVDTVSSAVHAASAMLSPFHWQHMFLPILPTTLLPYTSSPLPFIIGIRRYQFDENVRRALSDVIVVDADSGECTLLGDSIDVKNFIAGEPLGPLPTAASSAAVSVSNLTETGMGLMRAGVKMLRTSGISLDMTGTTSTTSTTTSLQSSSSSSNSQNPNNPQTENVVQTILNDIRIVLAKNPSKSYSATMRLGRSAADSSRDKWIAELDRTIRQSLLMFYVYLFGDITDDLNPAAARATLNDASAPGGNSNRGVAQNGDSFGFGDSRAAFKLKNFLSRRRQLGASNSLIEFLEAFLHSQMFERFCAERIVSFQNSISIRKPSTTTTTSNSRNSITSSTQGQSSPSKVSQTTTASSPPIYSEYEKTCTELKIQHLSSTIINIKYVIDEMARKQAIKKGTSGDETENEFHPLALQITSNSLASVSVSMASMTLSKVDPNQQLKEQLDQICQDASTDNIQYEKVMRVVWLRLEDCKMFNWKHGLRGLQLLHVLLLRGPAAVLTDALDHFSLIASLQEYSADQSNVCTSESREQIKRTAREVLKLLLDHSLLSLQRRWVTIDRLGGFPFNKLQQKILQQRKDDCKKMNIQAFNPQSINQIPSFRNLHEAYRPPLKLNIPAAPHLITTAEKHPSKPTILIEGDDDDEPTLPQVNIQPLSFDSFFTSTGELKVEPQPTQQQQQQQLSSTNKSFNHDFDNFNSDAFQSSSPSTSKVINDPFFGNISNNDDNSSTTSASTTSKNVDPFTSTFGSDFDSSPRPASYNNAVSPSASHVPVVSARPASMPVSTSKSFDPFTDPFTSPTAAEAFSSKNNSNKSDHTASFDMFNDDSQSQSSKFSDPFSDPFGVPTTTKSSTITTSSSKSSSDPFSTPFGSTTTSVSDPFQDPFTAPQKTSFSDPFSIPILPQSKPSNNNSFPVNDVFGGGILVPESKSSVAATSSTPKNVYHDPFADLLSPDINSPPPLPSGTIMPYTGIGGMGGGTGYGNSGISSSNYSTPSFSQSTLPTTTTTQFDYSMLQSQNKSSTQQTGPASNDPFANLGGNWSSKGNNSKW